MIFLISMTVCTVLILCNDIYVYFALNDSCVPSNISMELDSFRANLIYFLRYEVWNIPILLYFWPSVQARNSDDQRKDLTRFAHAIE